jgi:osmotically-inducible protein OsmY
MLYLEEKVGEIKGVKRVINQLTIGLWVTAF